MWHNAYDAYITSPEWYDLKDHIRQRARNRCEWCRLRPMGILHHRSYAHVGAEPEHDVMGLCSACHAVIHGLRASTSLRVQHGSLAHRGDPGEGRSALWTAYLQACAALQATAKLWHLSGWGTGVRTRAMCGNPYASGTTAAVAHVTCFACLRVERDRDAGGLHSREPYDRPHGSHWGLSER